MALNNNHWLTILYVSDSGLQCNKHNGYCYQVQYQDRQTDLGSWYQPWNWYFPRLRLGQSVYPHIALHFSNYYLNIFLMKSKVILKCYVIYHTPWICFKNDMLNIKHNILSNRELYDNYSQICIKRYKEKVALWDRSLESS